MVKKGQLRVAFVSADIKPSQPRMSIWQAVSSQF